MTVFAPPQRQRGAVLVIALVMLLIITLLGIGSMNEVVLESRITGNLIEQKRLRSAAESALREGERRIAAATAIDDCDEGGTVLCHYGMAEGYVYNFNDKEPYKGFDGNSELERDARWYVRFIGDYGPSGGGTNDGGSGCGALCSLETAPSGRQFFYEVNAQAYKDGDEGDTCIAATLCLTSTTLLIKK
ncbi:pilus assembly PilX family protein [Pseudomonas sediminis]|uniref:pilus assembly PilX family protein n=1 Tax=Pseudomonas sediminis TaxID=1691904 RepID=UPI00244AB26E|nr:PilX N-terminal domain-containing pilus assembly protein [Pseudomonas sediminis]